MHLFSDVQRHKTQKPCGSFDSDTLHLNIKRLWRLQASKKLSVFGWVLSDWAAEGWGYQLSVGISHWPLPFYVLKVYLQRFLSIYRSSFLNLGNTLLFLDSTEIYWNHWPHHFLHPDQIPVQAKWNASLDFCAADHRPTWSLASHLLVVSSKWLITMYMFKHLSIWKSSTWLDESASAQISRWVTFTKALNTTV